MSSENKMPDGYAKANSSVEVPATMDKPSFGIPKVTTSKVDRTKEVLAAKEIRQMKKQAGMMMGPMSPFSVPVSTQYLQTYYTSYADGSNWNSGVSDIPIYFTIMNQQNGGLLYWPATLREKYSWFRYWSRSDAYVGRALDMLSNLVMSKISLNMPKMPEDKKELAEEIKDFYDDMCDRLGLFDVLMNMLREHNMIGNTFVFAEFNEKKVTWDRLIILPPEEIRIFHVPYSEQSRVEYRPERLMKIIGETSQNQDIEALDDTTQRIIKSIPEDIKNMIVDNGAIILDTDPNSGSFVFHFARNRSPYMDLGESILDRITVPMLMKEHYKYTQLSLCSRNMTPKNIINANGLDPAQLDDLRMQVDLSYMDPDYSIVTNYDVQWNQIGAESRLLQLDAEYERIDNQLFAGLGVTRELLTGEGTFAGNKITIEVLNTLFLQTREKLQEYVEKFLFRPIAEKKGWFETKKNGVKKYFYPKLTFNRITIRDNQEVFDSLFQLYQKGSLPVDTIYELFNLDPESLNEKIKSDLFTVKDSTYNNFVSQINTAMADKIIEQTNLIDKYSSYLGLEKIEENESEGGESEQGAGEEESIPVETQEEADAGETGTTEETAPSEETPEEAKQEEAPEESTEEEPKQEPESENITFGE